MSVACHSLIDKVKEYLKVEYGLTIDFSEAKFEQLEVNITSGMDLPFEEYEYLLSQMVKRYEYSIHVDKEHAIKQFNFFNKSVQGKIYDKTKQLKEVHNISVDKRYIRIEYTLNKPSKIKSCFQSEYIYCIKDYDIEQWIISQIKNDLIQPIHKHIQKTNNVLIKIAKKERSMDNRKWTRNFVNRAMALKENMTKGKLSLVTDMNQIVETILKLTSRSNTKRTNNRLKLAYSKYEFVKGNFTKLQEITDKFT